MVTGWQDKLENRATEPAECTQHKWDHHLVRLPALCSDDAADLESATPTQEPPTDELSVTDRLRSLEDKIQRLTEMLMNHVQVTSPARPSDHDRSA